MYITPESEVVILCDLRLDVERGKWYPTSQPTFEPELCILKGQTMILNSLFWNDSGQFGINFTIEGENSGPEFSPENLMECMKEGWLV